MCLLNSVLFVTRVIRMFSFVYTQEKVCQKTDIREECILTPLTDTVTRFSLIRSLIFYLFNTNQKLNN